MLGIGAYADGSRLIDDNIRAFKGIQSQTELLNKQLQQEAGEKADLDTLKNIGQEFGFKQGKDLLAKYGAKIYSGKIPFSNDLSIEDLDKEAGKGLDNVLERAFSSGVDVPPPLNQSSNVAKNAVNKYNMLSGDPEIDAIRESNLYSRSLNATGAPIDTQKPMVAKTEDISISKPSSSDVQMTEVKEPVADPEDLAKATDEGVSVEDFQKHLDEKYDFGGTNETSEVGESVAAGLGEDVATEEGLQASAGLFASTGILAPLAGAAEVAGDVFALYEGIKGVGEWFSRDILHQTAPSFTPVDAPTQPKTLAQRGYLVTPSVDTYDLPHNTLSNAW